MEEVEKVESSVCPQFVDAGRVTGSTSEYQECHFHKAWPGTQCSPAKAGGGAQEEVTMFLKMRTLPLADGPTARSDHITNSGAFQRI